MKFTSATLLGHAGVLFSCTSDNGALYTIAIDPWISGNPLAPDSARSLKQLDAIVLTHGHADHAGDAARLSKELGSKIFATWELATLLKSDGVSEQNLIPMNKGGSIKWGTGYIALTHAIHSSSYDTSSGSRYAGEPCGVILNDGQRSIYHTGDTALFSDMKLIARFHTPSLAFVCVGDRFTMGPREAAYAVSLIGCKTAVPIHHSTFDMLTGTPEQFKAECSSSDCEVCIVNPGQPFKI